MLLNIFTNIQNFFNGVGTFFNLIFANWIGLIVGLVLAIIISLILNFKFFHFSLMGNFLGFLIIILMCSAGVAINNLFQKKTSETIFDYIEGTTIVDPTKYVTITANGGFSKSYIDEKENDPNCPTAEDKTFPIYMEEYNDIVVCFYKYKMGNNDYWLNSIFQKTNCGLVFTGCFNVTVERSGPFWNRSSNFVNEMFLGTNFYDLETPLNQYNGVRWLFKGLKADLPRYYTEFYKPCIKAITNGWDSTIVGCADFARADKDKIYACASVGCYGIYNNYFQQLDKIGIKCENDDLCFENMNTFYNTVYNAVKVNNFDTVIDITSLVGDVQNGVVYKSNRFLNVKFDNHSNKNAFGESNNIQNDIYVEQNKPDKNVVAVGNPPFYVHLINKGTNSIDKLDLSTCPVQIRFVNKETQNQYFYNFNTFNSFENGLMKAMPFGTYDYFINSNVIDFDGNCGEIVLTNKSCLLNFYYSYNGDFVNTSVKLSPLSNVDLSSLDLSKKPVVITLTNKNDNTLIYNFTFANNESLESGITKSIKIGSYNYSIDSDSLSFAEKTGEIEFAVNANLATFYYDYISNDCTLIRAGDMSSDEYIYNADGDKILTAQHCLCFGNSTNQYRTELLSLQLKIFVTTDKTTTEKTVELKKYTSDDTLYNEYFVISMEAYHNNFDNIKIQITATTINNETLISPIYDLLKIAPDFNSSAFQVYTKIEII